MDELQISQLLVGKSNLKIKKNTTYSQTSKK